MSASTNPILPEDAVWFALLDGEPAGPMAQTDLEDLALRRQLFGSTLVWREGLNDWLPIADLPELFTVLLAGERRMTGIDWVPSNALALDVLVAAELEGEETACDGEQPPAGLPVLPAGQDLWLSELMSPPTAGISRSPRSSAGRLLAPAAAGAIMSVGLAALAMGGGIERLWSASESSPGASAVTAAVGSTSGSLAESEPVTLVPLVSTTEPELPVPAPRPARATTAKRTEKRSRPAPPSVDEEGLTRDKLIATVRAQGSTVVPCLRTALRRGELLPGRMTLSMSWRITPRGVVVRPEVIGPPEVLPTSLPACVETRMRQWRFPASEEGARVNRFPFGPFNVPRS